LRKYYRLTEKGFKEQEQETAQWSMINELIGQVLNPAPTAEG
jgi:DNA-binding PadR family transcriptional regulator